MAATFWPSGRVLLGTLRTSLSPAAAGAGSPRCRCPLGAKRYLLTDNIMKLKEFQQKKMAVAHSISGTKETYFSNLEDKLAQNRLILKDELRTLLHLCQSHNDVELAKNVIYRYHAENRNFTVGEFKFGPVFMRLCYELDLEESAVELIKDQAEWVNSLRLKVSFELVHLETCRSQYRGVDREIKVLLIKPWDAKKMKKMKRLLGFFSDSTSFNILMDMLFIKGKYESALEVLIEMKNQGVKFSVDTYVLAFAICYKLNTPKSFKICTTLREEALIKGEVLSRRASCFLVALALNQDKVAKAKTIFSQIINPESITCTNLNIIIHIQSNMLETVMEILENAAEGHLSRFVKRHEFSEEVLTKLKEKVKDIPTLLTRFDEIYGKLHINGQVTAYTLDALLCYTPRDRKSHILPLTKRTVSQRTFQPLSHSLLAE